MQLTKAFCDRHPAKLPTTGFTVLPAEYDSTGEVLHLCIKCVRELLIAESASKGETE